MAEFGLFTCICCRALEMFHDYLKYNLAHWRVCHFIEAQLHAALLSQVETLQLSFTLSPALITLVTVSYRLSLLSSSISMSWTILALGCLVESLKNSKHQISSPVSLQKSCPQSLSLRLSCQAILAKDHGAILPLVGS